MSDVPSQTFLAFETSHRAASVALWYKGQMHLAQDAIPNRQAEVLVPMIEDLLKAQGIFYPDLDGVIVPSGPGSFTGLRIALATARGLKLATELPFRAVSAMECHAWKAFQTRPEASRVAVILDARRGQLYWQAFAKAPFHALCAPIIVDVEDAFTMCAPFDGLIVGAGAGLLELDGIQSDPPVDAKLLIQWALANWEKTKESDYLLEPLYIRPPDAKIPKPFLQTLRDGGG